MLRAKSISLILICLSLAAGVVCAAPKDMTVYGRPAVGAFGVSTLEQIEGAAKLSMTLIYSYSSSWAQKQLDPTTPEGQAVVKHRMQVMYPLCGRFTQVRLARDLSPTDTTVFLKSDKPEAIKAFPEKGYVVIEGERIEYSGRTDDSFIGCTRGAGGAVAARHGAGLLLCDSEGLRKDILAVKDSPSLWGYWLVDDNRPQEIDSLREMSRIIRATDRDAQGRPNSHIIVMGIGGSSAMANYDAGICDALGVNPYPYHKGALNPTTRKQMNFIMGRARSLEPEIGLIGVYQAFAYGDSPNWKQMPTPEQVREDMLSFYDWGADGLLAFIYHWEGPNKEPQGLDADPAVCEMIKKTNEDILAGKVKRTVPPSRKMEWFTVLTGAAAKSSPGGKPAYDLDDAAKLEALVKGRPDRLAAEPFTAEGQSYPLKVSFPAWDKADPKSDRWPIAQIDGTALTTDDWSGVRYLEQPLYNSGATAVTIRVSLEDASKGWWERADVEIPPQTPVLLRVPMDEARLSIEPAKIKRWLLWEADPATAVSFRMATPMLVPVAAQP
jgi:hypothetical protein